MTLSPEKPRPLRILFVCSHNRWRSPTEEAMFATLDGVEAASAGTSHDADTPLSGDLVEWEDMICVMEKHYRERLTRQYGSLLRDKTVRVLGVADNYKYMDPALVRLIRGKFPQWFG